MYLTFEITGLYQHTHRFLLRECKTNSPPDIFVLISVSFGDRRTCNIATNALRKTAELGGKILPVTVEVLERGTYVDDIIDSFHSPERAENVKANIERIMQPGRFNINKWLTSWEDPLSENKSMLDNPKQDYNKRVIGMQ